MVVDPKEEDARTIALERNHRPFLGASNSFAGMLVIGLGTFAVIDSLRPLGIAYHPLGSYIRVATARF